MRRTRNSWASRRRFSLGRPWRQRLRARERRQPSRRGEPNRDRYSLRATTTARAPGTARGTRSGASTFQRLAGVPAAHRGEVPAAREGAQGPVSDPVCGTRPPAGRRSRHQQKTKHKRNTGEMRTETRGEGGAGQRCGGDGGDLLCHMATHWHAGYAKAPARARPCGPASTQRRVRTGTRCAPARAALRRGRALRPAHRVRVGSGGLRLAPRVAVGTFVEPRKRPQICHVVCQEPRTLTRSATRDLSHEPM